MRPSAAKLERSYNPRGPKFVIYGIRSANLYRAR